MSCFLYLEGTLALGIVLALAEYLPWWAVPVIPAAVAAVVKFNDVVAGALSMHPSAEEPPADETAATRASIVIDDASPAPALPRRRSQPTRISAADTEPRDPP